jgi:hypothetical protein
MQAYIDQQLLPTNRSGCESSPYASRQRFLAVLKIARYSEIADSDLEYEVLIVKASL